MGLVVLQIVVQRMFWKEKRDGVCHLLSDTLSLVGQNRWTNYLFEGYVGIYSISKPVETPVTTSLKSDW